MDTEEQKAIVILGQIMELNKERVRLYDAMVKAIHEYGDVMAQTRVLQEKLLPSPPPCAN